MAIIRDCREASYPESHTAAAHDLLITIQAPDASVMTNLITYAVGSAGTLESQFQASQDFAFQKAGKSFVMPTRTS